MMQSVTTNDVPASFWKWARASFGDDIDRIDVIASYDRTLTDGENRSLFKEAHPRYFLEERFKTAPSQVEFDEAERTYREDERADAPTDFDYFTAPPKSIAIVGDTRSGKTALGYAVTSHLALKFGLPCYLLQHPRPEIVTALGYKNLYDIADVERLHDCILWIDEPQLSIPQYEKRNNTNLMALLSLCGQRGVTLILSTSDTRYINRGLESYVECWMVKDLDPQLVKQGSTVRNIVKRSTFIDWTGFRCEQDEYVMHSRSLRESCGRKRFSLPPFWSERLSKPYRDENSDGKCERRCDA